MTETQIKLRQLLRLDRTIGLTDKQIRQVAFLLAVAGVVVPDA